jgi:hypothetical protein
MNWLRCHSTPVMCSLTLDVRVRSGCPPEHYGFGLSMTELNEEATKMVGQLMSGDDHLFDSVGRWLCLWIAVVLLVIVIVGAVLVF